MKAVFITGISRGIGLEIAKVFSKDGYHVYGSSRSNFDLNKALDTDNAAHFALDVNDRSSINDIFNEIAKSEFILECLINNAGITGPTAPLWEYNVEKWNKIVQINLMGTFNCCRAIVPNMISNNYGRIVNVASVAGKDGNANASAYSAAKAGTIGLTKSLGKELADKNIDKNYLGSRPLNFNK